MPLETDAPSEEESAVLSAVLRRLGTEAPEERALADAVNPTLLLQFVRGYWAEKERLETTYAKMRESLAWRRTMDIQHILTAPQPELVRDFADWRRIWPCDYYGTDRTAHPLVCFRVGMIKPGELIARFSLPVRMQAPFVQI
eukprot:SAG11_NODE_2159_length_3730_cov_1.805288_5_plen_142_part_00